MSAHTSTITIFSLFAVIGAVACSSATTDASSSSAAVTEAAPQCTVANDSNEAYGTCLTCCAGDGPAKQIVADAIACFGGCKDDSCADGCETAYETSCAAAGDACQVAEACMDKSCEGTGDPKQPNRQINKR